MHAFLNFDQLSSDQLTQYRLNVTEAFPVIIHNSKFVQTFFPKVEKYFPQCQRVLVDSDKAVIGIINTLPFFWDESLANLPLEGWDWLIEKGTKDFENNVTPNYLGGLQIILTKEHQGKGLSRILINEGKRMMESSGFKNFIIPIRPTFKHKLPAMPMSEYINFKEKGELFDPWIRTHQKSGAKVIKVCDNAMNISGDIPFWEKILNHKIQESGKYKVPGGLNLASIDVAADYGVYNEANVWIYYK